jgi:hypothetical protein
MISRLNELGPKALAAFERSPCKYWAMETIDIYARWLLPLPLEKGDDAALARLIEMAAAP